MKFKPKTTEKIIELVRKGNYKKVAAAYCGISEKTLYEWQKEGQADIQAGKITKKSEFCKSLEQAESKFEIESLEILNKETSQDPKMRLEILARKYPDRWGRKEKHEVKADIDGKLEITEKAVHHFIWIEDCCLRIMEFDVDNFPDSLLTQKEGDILYYAIGGIGGLNTYYHCDKRFFLNKDGSFWFPDSQ